MFPNLKESMDIQLIHGREYYVQLPKPSAFEVLEALIGDNYRGLREVHVAVDFVYHTKAALTAAERVVRAHLIKPHRGKQETCDTDNVMYFATSRAPRNIAIYADRPCRITGDPRCLHVEWKFQTPAACRAGYVDTFDKLAGFDHLEFWQGHFRLCRLNVEQLGRLAWNHAYGKKRRKPRVRTLPLRDGRVLTYHEDVRAGCALLRGPQYRALGDDAAYVPLDSVPLQDVIDNWGEHRDKRLLARSLERMQVSLPRPLGFS